MQQLRTNPVLNSRKNKLVKSKLDKNSSGWNCLEGWMATKSWEVRSMEELHRDTSEIAPKQKEYYSVRPCSNSSEHDTVKIRRNNISTRISAKPTSTSPTAHSTSDTCSEFLYDDSTTSNSSASTFGTPGSSNNTLAEGNSAKRSYMNLTESIKAKQRGSNYLSHSIENLQFHKKPSPLSKGLARRSADCDLYYYSVDLGKDLYPPLHMDRYGGLNR